MERVKLVFESYNHAVERAYEGLFETGKDEDFLKLGEDKVNSMIESELETWGSTPMPEFGNKTPIEIFDEISSSDEALEVFKLGAIICDRGIPTPLLKRMGDLGEDAVNRLILLSGDRGMMDDEEGADICLTSIRTLGKLKSPEAVKPLLDILYSLDEKKENFVEEINDALVDIGKPIIEPVVVLINGLEKIEYLDEYVLNALVRVGKNNKDDNIFRCIKGAFVKMEDKLLGALCLGDYGDGRAIPALRGFIEKNRNNIDKPTFMEIAAAIKKLGGNIDDLVKGTAF